MAVSPASSTFPYPGIFVCEESLTRGLSFKKHTHQFDVKISTKLNNCLLSLLCTSVMNVASVLSLAKRNVQP
jgi:hypothetical protein